MMKGIILHGGHGTRLRPLTHTGPKQLLPIANKPMSQYCLESIRETGITEIAIIIGGTGSEKVKEYYGDGKEFGVKITYVQQDYPKGISHAIGLCKDFIANEKFIVFLGDNILFKDLKKYVSSFKKNECDAFLLLCEVDNPSRFGIANLKNNKIIEIMEKPKNPPTNLAVTGIYFLHPKIFDVIKNLKPSWRNELEITDALDIMIKEKNNIDFDIVTDYWKDTGTPEDIINANSFILNKTDPYFLGEKDENVKLTGNVMIGKNTVLNEGVKIIGPVMIGENCIIDDAEIGPNVSIGNNTKVNKCHIMNTIIMNNCNLDSNILLNKSIIPHNSEIKTNDKKKEVTLILGEGTKILLGEN